MYGSGPVQSAGLEHHGSGDDMTCAVNKQYIYGQFVDLNENVN